MVESEVTLRYNGDYALLDEEIIEIPKALVIGPPGSSGAGRYR